MGPVVDRHPAQIAAMFDAIAARYDRLNRLLSAGLDRRWRAQAIRSLGLTGRETVLDLCTGTADLALAAACRPANQPPPRLRRSAEASAKAEAGRYDCDRIGQDHDPTGHDRDSVGAARVVGIDFAHQMLRQAQSKLKVMRQDGAGVIQLARGDAACIPVGTSSVDAVTVGFGIRNVRDVPRALGEIHRVLRPGGRVAILEFAIPETPGLRQCYLWYFRHVLPRIGRAISRHATAYSYLPASVDAFAPPDELSAMLRSAGLDRVEAHPLTMGVVYLHVAVKPPGDV